MTTINQLEALANAAIECIESDGHEDLIHKHLDYLADAANPATIKALVALCRLQHEALKEYTNVVTSNYDPNSWSVMAKDDGHHAREAIAAYERFNGGTE